MLNLAASQFDLVFVNPGYQFDSYLEEIASTYPNVTFVYADGVSAVTMDNVISVSYLENEGSYLAGVMAAMMTTRTDYEGINEDKVLGFVGAVDSTTIHNFLIGFEQGVASVDSEIKVLPVYVGDYNDPATGKSWRSPCMTKGRTSSTPPPPTLETAYPRPPWSWAAMSSAWIPTSPSRARRMSWAVC